MQTQLHNDADVTICIPAWQAAAFIERTLQSARGQTHPGLRILVSVDLGDDDTGAICRRHAVQDARIRVIEQARRLGWSENANALLAQVRTEFFFLYFHDDIIEPTYVEHLRAALLTEPTAASAHSDLERFGHQPGLDPGNHYHGHACRRLLAYLAGPVKGTLLRSLTRRAVLEQGLHFPAIGDAGFWRCHPFVLTLLAAGPALHVPQVLYRRWLREGGVTSAWDVRSTEPLVEGQAASARLCREIIERSAADAGQREVLRHALCLFNLICTRREELRLGRQAPLDPSWIHPDFERDRAVPAAVARLPADQQQWLAATAAELAALEAAFPPTTSP